MSAVSDYELAELRSLTDDQLLWRLAWAREYVKRIQHEMFQRMSERDVKRLEGVGIVGKRGSVSTTYTLTESQMARMKAGDDVDAEPTVSEPWISLSIDENAELKQQARSDAARVLGGTNVTDPR